MIEPKPCKTCGNPPTIATRRFSRGAGRYSVYTQIVCRCCRVSTAWHPKPNAAVLAWNHWTEGNENENDTGDY